MPIRAHFHLLLAGLVLFAGCGEPERGPIMVSAIGGAPDLVNPNLERLDPASAFLLEATAQGLVHFDPLGQVEPALAQSWIVSDDGLRYTFRLARVEWASGGPVTAQQVVQRLNAASSRASSNALKPILGAIAEIEAMTDEVLEIRLVGPRPNFLQILAQPEMAIIRNGAGTGPYRAVPAEGGAVRLSLPATDEDAEAAADAVSSDLVLRGESAAMAVARFDQGGADFVTGGTAGDLPIARAAEPEGAALRFDPAPGLFGLAFADRSDAVADPALRRALSMTVDRAALVGALGVANLQPRATIVPPGVADLPAPAVPDWAATTLAARRQRAARTIADTAGDEPLALRVAMPEGPGYRLLFAHLRRDWRLIGVEAERVDADADADLRLVDAVAPANLASWYLRRFSCGRGAGVCSEEADAALAAARSAADAEERQAQLAAADRLLTDAVAFIPLAAPVRWSLVSPRLTGFQPNPFARHFAGRLVDEAP